MERARTGNSSQTVGLAFSDTHLLPGVRTAYTVFTTGCRSKMQIRAAAQKVET